MARFYANDTWQVTKKLTLNLGFRVDLQEDWTERYNRIVVFNTNQASPTASQVGLPNLTGAFDLVNSAQHPSRSAFPSWNHISPRVGLSYQVDANTVIRTGYGIFYLPVDVRWNDAPHNLFINSINTTWVTTLADGVTPRTPLSNPFPGGIAQPQSSQGFINVQGIGLGAALGNYKAPYVQQWNFDIQHQFAGATLVDIACAGAKGTHLPMHTQDLDQLPPAFLPTSAADVAALTKLVPNPFYGVVQTGGVSANRTIKAAQLLLPYPQYDDVSMEEPDNRDSSYNSLQVKFRNAFLPERKCLLAIRFLNSSTIPTPKSIGSRRPLRAGAIRMPTTFVLGAALTDSMFQTGSCSPRHWICLSVGAVNTRLT